MSFKLAFENHDTTAREIKPKNRRIMVSNQTLFSLWFKMQWLWVLLLLLLLLLISKSCVLNELSRVREALTRRRRGGRRGWSLCWKRDSSFNARCTPIPTRASATCTAWIVWTALSAPSASLSTTRITVLSRFLLLLFLCDWSSMMMDWSECFLLSIIQSNPFLTHFRPWVRQSLLSKLLLFHFVAVLDQYFSWSWVESPTFFPFSAEIWTLINWVLLSVFMCPIIPCKAVFWWFGFLFLKC